MAMTRAGIALLSDADLMAKICEEASEVIKAVCKHQVHGETPFAAEIQYDNVSDANEEFTQLSSLMYEYRGRFGYRGFGPCDAQ